MTDNEIIKALECCSVETEEICHNKACPLIKDRRCVTTLSRNALDLINRQQAEIERLLQKLQQPQAEAIKEFAERLKKEAGSSVATIDGIVVAGSRYYIISETKLYSLVKEMVVNRNER
jgi:hypothetical protein